jgi:predicted metal-dependent hydrolase
MRTRCLFRARPRAIVSPPKIRLMKKHERIAALVSRLSTDADLSLDPRYVGYFTCFNVGHYYEAHDVLENLWLQTEGRDHLFFKGLIQVAGAFVHLQKQMLHPDHLKHGRRLRPAVRLFDLAIANLEPFAPTHLHLDVAQLCRLCRQIAEEVTASEFQRNPWQPEHAPQLRLEPATP